MDATRLQSLVYKGYGKAAIRTGLPFTVYRATSPSNPIAAGNAQGTILAMLDASPSFKLAKPNTYGHPLWYVLADGARLRERDYLQAMGNDFRLDASPLDGPDTLGSAALAATDRSTYFIAGMQPLLPILAVACNRMLSVRRPSGNAGVGAQPYGGDVITNEVEVMTAVPASVLTKSRGEIGIVNLPGDVKLPWSEILMPAWPGVEILFADVLYDEHGQRYLCSATEQTDLGWRLLAVQATA